MDKLPELRTAPIRTEMTDSEKLTLMVELYQMQARQLEEVLAHLRRLDVAVRFAVDAVNGLYGALDRVGE